MRAQLDVARADNEIEIGILMSSSLDLEAKSLKAFTALALESAKTRKKSLLNFHIQSFACASCPKEVMAESCVSGGKYCAFFPKMNSFDKEPIFEEEKQAGEGEDSLSAEFTGREIMISNIYEKCHQVKMKEMIEETGTGDFFDLEKKSIDHMVTRLSVCESYLANSNKYVKTCLFDPSTIAPASLRDSVYKCY